MFIVGCATGGVAAQLVVPPVRAGTSPTRWEYQCAVIKTDAAAAVTSALNTAGAKGWELASLVPAHADHEFLGNDYGVDAYTLCAKRALP